MSSGRVEKSPHEQEIKFFAKVKLNTLLSKELDRHRGITNAFEFFYGRS